MIDGVVTNSGLPQIRVAVAGRDWPATIDTGFNGWLELPLELEDELDCVFLGQDRTILAGGVVIDEDYYSVQFPFDGRAVEAEVTFANVRQLLLGTALLKPYRLEIDFPAQTVRLDRVE